MRRLTLFLGLAFCVAAACGKDPGGPNPQLHDPEILFHFFYHRDSAGGPLHTEPYPDTAIMRWFEGMPGDSVRHLLAQVAITGTDTVCAYFLVASGTSMYFDLGWKRHGDTTWGVATVGPFNAANPDDYDPYWDVSISEDTLTGSTSAGLASHRTASFCPAGMPRDSITPTPVVTRAYSEGRMAIVPAHQSFDADRVYVPGSSVVANKARRAVASETIVLAAVTAPLA